MHILVIGASQGTGSLAVRDALNLGHEVTAFARSPEKLALKHKNLHLFAGDFHQAASVEKAVAGKDAVIITASATSLKAFKENPNYFSQGTAHVISAMKTHGVKRLVVLSALGVGDSRPLLNIIARFLLVHFLLRLPYADHERQEKMVKESGLDWVIVRPGRLLDGAAKGNIIKKTTIEALPSSISRADVASFLVEAAIKPDWVKKAVQIGTE